VKSCFNLAAIYKKGDGAVVKNDVLFAQYKKQTEDLAQLYGGIDGKKIA
jgi:hypothetical protein